jgi:uncharacterized DUF497 family protein
MEFEWDDAKNRLNVEKHGISFYEAQTAFLDKKRIIFPDMKHSSEEKRYFCIGTTVAGGVATVRFTKRSSRIRIIGAGYWREGKKLYDQQH